MTSRRSFIAGILASAVVPPSAVNGSIYVAMNPMWTSYAGQFPYVKISEKVVITTMNPELAALLRTRMAAAKEAAVMAMRPLLEEMFSGPSFKDTALDLLEYDDE